MKTKYKQTTPAICPCGQPAENAGQRTPRGSNANRGRCRRCRTAEGESYHERRRSVACDERRRRERETPFFHDVDRACTRWLIARGIPTPGGWRLFR